MYRHMLRAAAVCASIGAPAWGQDATRQEIDSLREQVAELKETVAALKAGQEDPGALDAARAAEVRALVTGVLADAESRASLQAEGANAGWDKGFFLRSADGNFLLRVKGQLDFRWTLNNAHEALNGEDTQYGFAVRRAKLVFEGNVVDPSWQYKFQGAFDRDGGAFELELAYVLKKLNDDFGLQFGQFKLPFLVEENTSSSRQLAVERSLVNEQFNQDYSKAVQAAWDCGPFRLQGAYSDGFGSGDTDFNDLDPTTSANNVTFRFDWLAKGTWKQFEQFTSARGSVLGFRTGAAIALQKSKYSTPFKEEFVTWTIDAQLEGDGWNAFGYIVGRHNSFDDPAVSDQDQFGVVLQAGFMVSDAWELFGRYEWGDSDIAGQDDLSVITAGTNWYISGQNLKWSNDIGVGLDSVSATWASSGAGWRTDRPGEDGQVVVRSQFQLLF
jgi:hypothetical protein